MMRNNKWTQLINFSLSAILCTHLTIAISGETVAQPIDNCTDSTGIQLGICVNTDNDSLTVLAQQQKQIESSGHPSSGGGSSTLDEQRAQKTADNTPDPRALAYEEWARCKAAAPGKGPKGSAASSTNYDDACPLPPAPQRGNDQAQDPGRQPTTEDILYAAATVIHADGAGLYKRPLNVSYRACSIVCVSVFCLKGLMHDE